ncbi:MAG: hypothetical protein WD229_19005, partial [Pirellulales bacterium]
AGDEIAGPSCVIFGTIPHATVVDTYKYSTRPRISSAHRQSCMRHKWRTMNPIDRAVREQ